MANMVQSTSEVFGFYTLSQLAVTTPTVVLELYAFALGFNGNETLVVQSALAFWAFCSIVQFGVICYAAAVNIAATEVGSKFYKAFVAYACTPKKIKDGLCGGNGEESAVMQKATALLTRMQLGDISITVHDMAPIKKGFTLAMLSLIFNYFFLLLQFALQGTGAPGVAGRISANDSVGAGN